MHLEIVTPEASLVSGEVTSVTVPGMDGEFQMLNNHAAIVALLVEGKVSFDGNPTIAEGFENIPARRHHRQSADWPPLVQLYRPEPGVGYRGSRV